MIIITDRVSREGKAVGCVRPSVCRSACANRLTSEVESFVNIAPLRLKVTIAGQGQTSMSSAYGCGNAVT